MSKPTVPRTCLICGAPFLAKPTHIRMGRAKYCSRACQGKATSQRQREENNPFYTGKIRCVCQVCGKEFEQYASQQKVVCSKRCSGRLTAERQRGEKSHLWRGGKTAETMLLRTSAEYGHWRDAVYQRDNYACQMCGERGGRLTVHHIQRFATHPERRLDIDNGITLCWPCHSGIRGREQEYETEFLTYTQGYANAA